MAVNFISSFPANGDTGIFLGESRFTLTFDQNVTSDNVWENNQTQIQLLRGTTVIAARIVRSADFEQRRNIFVEPVSLPLQQLTTYTIRILPGIRSKAGETLGQTILVRFTTEQREE